MIVCVCHAVSEGSIRAAAASGASHEDVVAETGAGSSCGCCAEFVAAIVHEEAGCSSMSSPCPGCPRRSSSH